MPSNLHRTAAVLSLTILLHHLLAAGISQAQSPPDGNTTTTTNNNNNNNNNNYFTSAKFNPSMAIIIVVLISAFFFLGFFSIYIRQCGGGGGIAGGRLDALAAVAVGGRSRRQRGLDPTVLETFPTLIYSQVKEHKIGKGALECAICLNEFEDDDSIRLLPKCDHVFHQDCIDAWLSTHVTCPVCRTNYADDTAAVAPPATAAADPTPASEAAAGDSAPSRDDVAIAVDDEGERERKELDRIASRVRRSGSRRQRNLPRSHSTGHSVTLRGEGLERFTLRLPESVRKDIIAAGMLRRERSLGRVGEESSRRGRSVRLGRSDRWPSVFVRSLSARIPAWGNWRRGGDEGSVKEGSAKGRFAGAGGSVRPNASGGDSESSTAALNRV